MIISPKSVTLANHMRQIIQSLTDTVSDGEGVAMVVLWSFYMDHARLQGMDIEALARDQLEGFIKYSRDNVTLVRQH